MTGNQPTPAKGTGARGEILNPVDIEGLVKGCGVQFCRVGDPYRLKEFIALLKEAVQYSRENGPAVVISRRPCLIDRLREEQPGWEPVKVEVADTCDGCGFCIDHFECPALVLDPTGGQVRIDTVLCNGCGVCISVCPKKSIKEIKS